MSKIAKSSINIPSGVTVNQNGSKLTVSGPKGNLSLEIPEGIKLDNENGKIMVSPIPTGKSNNDNLAGLFHTLTANMIKGVVEEWQKIVELSGTGYRAAVSGSDLNLAVGFSHPVVIKAPAGITFETKDNKITVKGADKAMVGQMAAIIRGIKPADPYKAKGFKYADEVIVRKAGKAAKAGATGGK